MYGKVAAASLMLAAAALLSACAGSLKPANPASPPRDARRVVALMPTFADELCAMGKSAYLVGVSQYARTASCAPNAAEVANFASVDTEKVISLHPDVVLAIPAQRSLTAPLARAGVSVVFMRDDTFDDIFGDIRTIASVIGDRGAGNALVERLRRRTEKLRAAEHARNRPSVFVVLQGRPIWTVGPQSYISTLVRMAGGRNAVSALPRAYAQYSAEALVRLQPDAIVAGSDVHLASLLDREPWRSLRAVRENHVFIVPDPAMLERPGPNYNEGLSWLIEHLRPLST